jgi:DUF1680 family protein
MHLWSNLASIVCFTVLALASCHTGDTPDRISTLPLADVELLEGPFRNATELSKSSALSYDPDRFLAGFRSEAGLEPRAEHYRGWESETIAGHSLGHYLSGLSLLYAGSRDARFLNRIEYIVSELEAVQGAHGDGYVGAIPNGKNIFETEIAAGEIRAHAFSLNEMWAPFYTFHKMMAGLRDAYRLAGSQTALEIEKGFADWIHHIVANLNEREVQAMLACEHGGINEVLVDLSVDTGDSRYLSLSRVFHHEAILDSLAAGYDILPGKHGNTQIPKLIGLARRYEVSGEIKDRDAVEFFWDRVVHHHSYVTGGHGNHEYFGQPDRLRNRLSNETTETCNVYNMLKLSQYLFGWTADATIADFYERALFNHILSSQHPRTGRVIYNLSLEMGGHKLYEDPEGFTCCVGTGMESHSKHGQHIFYKGDESFYVAQFIAAKAEWVEKGVSVIQSTQFPNEQRTTLRLDMQEPTAFTLFVRYPSWATEGFGIRINDRDISIRERPGSFVALERTWSDGDVVRVEFPFSLRLESMPDDSLRVAVMYGPLVLAGDLGPVDDDAAGHEGFVPVLFTVDRDPSRWLEAVGGQPNTFQIAEGIGHPRSATLSPFYALHDRRYTVYWDMYDDERWAAHQQELQERRERRQALEDATEDFFQPGEPEAERKHKFDGVNVRVVEFRHRLARVADRGGVISFELGVRPDRDMALSVEYWGGFTGSKTFDILIEGQRVATENISGKQEGAFLDAIYDIPRSHTSGKDRIRVSFEPHSGHRAGPFFGARTIVK